LFISYKKLFSFIQIKTHFNKSESLFFWKILFSTFISSTLLYSCGNTKKNDFDLSNIRPPKKEKQQNIKNEEVPLSNEKIISSKEIKNKLITYKDRTEIFNSKNTGKVDPFSEGEFQSSKLNSNFKLTGFLTAKNKNYVFVSYQNNKGILTENSIGGVNTDLLPDGARVTVIDPINMTITIKYEGENINLKLQ
jgi:hypothetical protein